MNDVDAKENAVLVSIDGEMNRLSKLVGSNYATVISIRNRLFGEKCDDSKDEKRAEGSGWFGEHLRLLRDISEFAAGTSAILNEISRKSGENKNWGEK